MLELKRLNQFQFINKWGTVYTKLTRGWIVSNMIDCDDLVQEIIASPTFEESIEDLLILNDGLELDFL
ncbi:hypothetical protein [Pedobacter sp. FW305-3-2-15-E-R2A2]|uniref:hypothetical protein n=1 Tax=Pedobacter sp. FW305-3-2-15-E-R2A2 TaxID=3140251 RepID=UPI0031409178